MISGVPQGQFLGQFIFFSIHIFSTAVCKHNASFCYLDNMCTFYLNPDKLLRPPEGWSPHRRALKRSMTGSWQTDATFSRDEFMQLSTTNTNPSRSKVNLPSTCILRQWSFCDQIGVGSTSSNQRTGETPRVLVEVCIKR